MRGSGSPSPLQFNAGSNSSGAGAIVLNGETSPGVSDQDSFQLTMACLGSARGGNEVWQRTSMKHSVQGLCGRDCTPTSRPSVPKVARWQVYHSASSHGRVRLGSNPRSSVCCSSDASGALYPCLRQVAGVAVHSIQVATTAQLVHTQVFWGEGDSFWRAPQHVSAETRGESHYERPSPGSGLASKSRSRQSPFRSGGRWAPPVPWRSACDRHHNGVPGPHGRFCAPAMRNNRRGSHGPSPCSERAHLPRTCSGSRSGTPGGGGLRSRRPVVGRGPFVPQLVGKR